MDNRFPQSAAASPSDGSMVSVLRKLSFACPCKSWVLLKIIPQRCPPDGPLGRDLCARRRRGLEAHERRVRGPPAGAEPDVCSPRVPVNG